MSNSRLHRAGGFFLGPEPRLFAHRGASARAPENTLEAFRLAVAAGAPYLELDVHLTADDVLVVIHDASVIRTTGRRGRVSKMTIDALRKLDAGFGFTLDHGHSFPYRGRGILIPTLDEVLTAFPEARINVELKRTRDGAPPALARLLETRGAENRVLVASFEQDVLTAFRAAAPHVPTNFSKNEVREFLGRVRSGSFTGYQPPGEALQVPEFFGLRRVISPAFVEKAHQVGVEVHVWGVNEILDIQRLLALGIDGVMVDDPSTVVAAAEELGASASAVSMSGEGF